MNEPAKEPEDQASTEDALSPPGGTTSAPHPSVPCPSGTLVDPAADHPEDPNCPPDLQRHPRYLVLERLGEGAMGAVYKAVHLLLDRLVALKVIRPELVGRPGMARRFQREARAAARLRHPNIVTAYDADQAGDAHFLVLEFV